METTAVHWHIGHNLPGYLPDGDVGTCATFADAQGALLCDLAFAALCEHESTDQHECIEEPESDSSFQACTILGDDCGNLRARDLMSVSRSASMMRADEPAGSWLAAGIEWWIVQCRKPDCPSAGELRSQS